MMVKQLAVATVICVFAASGRAECNWMFAGCFRHQLLVGLVLKI